MAVSEDMGGVLPPGELLSGGDLLDGLLERGGKSAQHPPGKHQEALQGGNHAEGQEGEGRGPRALNGKNPKVISICESLDHKSRTHDLPYDLEEPSDERDITRGLMRLSRQALSKYVDTEPDIY